MNRDNRLQQAIDLIASDKISKRYLDSLGIEPIDKESYMSDWLCNTYYKRARQILKDYGYTGNATVSDASDPERVFKRYIGIDAWKAQTNELLITLQEYGEAFYAHGAVYYYEDLEEALKN